MTNSPHSAEPVMEPHLGCDVGRHSALAVDPRVERTRQAVVEAGMSVLVDEGPDGVHHAAIAAAANVSRTTLYKYWPTRAKLLFEILGSFDAHPAMEHSGDLRTDLLNMLGELQTSLADPVRRRVFSSMLAQAQWDADVVEAQRGLRALPLGSLETMFEVAAARGEVREGIVAIQAASRLIGPLMFCALVADPETMEIDLESLVDDWLGTVRARP